MIPSNGLSSISNLNFYEALSWGFDIIIWRDVLENPFISNFNAVASSPAYTNMYETTALLSVIKVLFDQLNEIKVG